MAVFRSFNFFLISNITNNAVQIDQFVSAAYDNQQILTNKRQIIRKILSGNIPGKPEQRRKITTEIFFGTNKGANIKQAAECVNDQYKAVIAPLDGTLLRFVDSWC